MSSNRNEGRIVEPDLSEDMGLVEWFIFSALAFILYVVWVISDFIENLIRRSPRLVERARFDGDPDEGNGWEP